MTASALGAGSLDLTGHTFLVTGSTDGIGQHTALRLAAAGATVLVHGRSRQRTDAAAARVKDAAARGSGGSKIGDVSDRVYSYVADLADLGQVRELAVAVRAEHPGGIHTLINNAGVYCEPADACLRAYACSCVHARMFMRVACCVLRALACVRFSRWTDALTRLDKVYLDRFHWHAQASDRMRVASGWISAA
jgi:NAD(P)-dependent dehydrogenase (short-subunit alcohol dehydrogenase family)